MFKLNLVEKLVINFNFGGNRRYELARNQGNKTTHVLSDIIESSVGSRVPASRADRDTENVLPKRG